MLAWEPRKPRGVWSDVSARPGTQSKELTQDALRRERPEPASPLHAGDKGKLREGHGHLKRPQAAVDNGLARRGLKREKDKLSVFLAESRNRHP